MNDRQFVLVVVIAGHPGLKSFGPFQRGSGRGHSTGTVRLGLLFGYPKIHWLLEPATFILHAVSPRPKGFHSVTKPI